MATAPPIQRVRNLAQNVLYNRNVLGSVPVSLDQLVKTRINSREFGLNPTSGSNAVFLQAAIDYAFSIGGGVVVVGEGTFTLESTITMKKGVYLLGAGDFTVFRPKNGLNADLFAYASGTQIQKSGFVSLSMDGNKGNNTSGNAVTINQTICPITGAADSELAFIDVRIENFNGDGIKIDGAGNQINPASGLTFYYNIRSSIFSRVIIKRCGGNGFNANLMTDSVIASGCIFALNKLVGAKFTGVANLYVEGLKTFYNGELDTSLLGGTSFQNSSRLTLIGCETQDENTNGFYFDTCSDIILNGCRADANAPRGLVGPTYSVLTGNGFHFKDCSYVVGTLASVSYAGGATQQVRGLYVSANGLPYSTVTLTAQNQASTNYLNDGEALSFSLGKTINGIQEVNGTSLFKSGFRLRGTNTYTKFDNFDSGGNGVILSISPVTADGTSNSAVRFFRDTNTSGVTNFNVFKGNNTATVNCVFAGNGNSFFNSDNGNIGLGAVITSGAKVQILGGVYSALVGPLPTTNPGAGNAIFEGWVQSALRNNAVGAAGAFTPVLNAVNQIDTFYSVNTTLPVVAPAGTWILFTENNSVNFAINPLTITAGVAWTIAGAASFTLNTPQASVMLVSNGIDRWNIAYQGKIPPNQEFVAQTAHALSVGNNVRSTASGYVKAQANSAANAKGVCGRVVQVINGNSFILQDSGIYGSGFTPGAEYWLSATTAGGDQTTAPSTTGQVQLPVGIGTPSGQFRILIQSGTVNP
jgi:hypothetical protein